MILNFDAIESQIIYELVSNTGLKNPPEIVDACQAILKKIEEGAVAEAAKQKEAAEQPPEETPSGPINRSDESTEMS
jgi:hypothetical protein